MELKITAQAQNTEQENYRQAKDRYERAARRYIREMNDLCKIEGIGLEFDVSNYFSNKYDR